MIKAVRAERGNDRVLLFDGGDSWQGSLGSYRTKGQDMAECVKLLKPDAMTGHWEFSHGEARVRELTASLGFPFLLRGLILIVMFGTAFRLMYDVGFQPEKGGRPLAEMRKIAANSIDYGWRVPAVKWLMVEALFTGGVGIYAFYALQPYLLELYGNPHAYEIAGLAAAIVAGAQILGGMAAPRIRGLFRRRTSALILMAGLSVITLALIGTVKSFWPVIGFTTVWGLLFAATMPIRQTYINGMIPSRQRATILSFDSMMSSTGGVWTQPVLGRVADVYGYAQSYLVSAGIAAIAVPCLALSRRQNAPADTIDVAEGEPAPQPA